MSKNNNSFSSGHIRKFKSFPIISRTYRENGGFPRMLLTRKSNNKRVEVTYFVEAGVIDEILDACSLENIWALASKTNNKFIRTKCLDRLNDYIENEQNVEYEKQKMSKEMIEMIFGDIVDEEKLVDREDGREYYYDKFKGR